jgi:uncharacterized surface anchored protein
VEYITTKIDKRNGADSSYSFKASNDSPATFWLDYYQGNGTTTERFVWTFGEDVSRYEPVALTYRLQLNNKSEVEGIHTIDTNISATFYPVDSEGNERDPQQFPVPEVQYEVVAKRSLKIIKTDEHGNPLQGAKFKLTESTGKYEKEFETDKDGVILYSEIPYGTYTLVETLAPAGHTRSDVVFTINVNKGDPSATASDRSDVRLAVDEDKTIVITIINLPVYVLPSTGGPGIYVYGFGGMVLMMGAALVLHDRRCKEMLAE